MSKRLHPLFAFLFSLFFCAAPADAQSLSQDLADFVATPAVPGYEQPLAEKIMARLGKHKLATDNLGNLIVTLGSGAPHRLIVAHADEPGYIVSGITDDGYLRVQRLPQQAPHGLFDQLHAAQPVQIYTREGKWISGVAAGLSTHLQGGRRDPPRGSHPDEMYIDIGASSAEEVRKAGVDFLDPLALERRLYLMGHGKATGVAVGDRFGAAALTELLRRVDAGKLQGTLTVAIVMQQWTGARGLDRLLQQVKPDEIVYVGRLLPRRGGGPGQQAQQAQPRSPQREPGSGVLIAMAGPEATPTGLAAEIFQFASENNIPMHTDFSAPVPRLTGQQAPVPANKFAHLGIATDWPVTPAELIDRRDLKHLVSALEGYVMGSVRSEEPPIGLVEPGSMRRRQSPPSATEILWRLVEVYGVSGYEGPVREEIARLLPPWAKPVADPAGNLILTIGSATPGSKNPRIAFIAHMDEIGYVVRSIAEDGRLVVQTRGGGIVEFFAGHAMFVHAADGIKPGVMELPAGWDTPNFQWPRGQQAPWRVDVGARNPAEVEALGIKVDDSLTVPKRYRPLYGTRANGRSFDDRVGSAALVAAAWALGPELKDREVTLAWVVEEEIGLRGAAAMADRLAREGRVPDYVFAVDTFVSADSPLESKRFADAPIGKGFVIRAVDNSNITRRDLVDKLIALARQHDIPVQYGTTGGGNDGSVFPKYGAHDIPISWPLRYSHSPGEVIDTRDLEALARIVAVIARNW
jgi:putative aminopeptidase FrvX